MEKDKNIAKTDCRVTKQPNERVLCSIQETGRKRGRMQCHGVAAATACTEPTEFRLFITDEEDELKE